jgi:hypothetical protein
MSPPNKLSSLFPSDIEGELELDTPAPNVCDPALANLTHMEET